MGDVGENMTKRGTLDESGMFRGLQCGVGACTSLVIGIVDERKIRIWNWHV